MTKLTFDEWSLQDSNFIPTAYEWQLIAKYSGKIIHPCGDPLTRGECNELHNLIDQYEEEDTRKNGVFANQADWDEQQKQIAQILNRLEQEI